MSCILHRATVSLGRTWVKGIPTILNLPLAEEQVSEGINFIGLDVIKGGGQTTFSISPSK